LSAAIAGPNAIVSWAARNVNARAHSLNTRCTWPRLRARLTERPVTLTAGKRRRLTLATAVPVR